MSINENEKSRQDSQRDIGAELLEAVRKVVEGNVKRVDVVPASLAHVARMRTRLSKGQFATALGVCKGTLQDWEKNHRQPSGAALTLIKIGAARPEVLCEVLGLDEVPRHD